MVVSRSSYVSYIRRCFLLRAHPDRFRKHSEKIIRAQSNIIQAFAERLTEPDFAAYIGHREGDFTSREFDGTSRSNQKKSLQYYLEKNNGELIEHTLPLHGNVEKLLSSLSTALKTTGLSIIKPPQSPSSGAVKKLSIDESKFNNNTYYQQSTEKHSRINHSYDVNTNRGRNLINFIENLNMDEIEQRKAERIDATAAAMIARQAFKFQSIDGTQLGWSSSSLAKTLRMLTKVYDEHGDKFNVDSFYPLQLIFSNDEFHSKLDLYSGTLMLNPGSTQEQWLETLMAVTINDLNTLRRNRKMMKNNLLVGQNYLNANIRRGYSCSSHEYYCFLERLGEAARSCAKSDNVHPQSSSKELTVGRLSVLVETSQACRRPIITNAGDIRVSASESPSMIVSSLYKLRSDALQKKMLEKEHADRAKELITMMKYQYGLTKVLKSRLMSVTSEQYIASMSKLLQAKEDLDTLKNSLTGNSLWITHDGSFCRLGDDGSLMIPWNWH